MDLHTNNPLKSFKSKKQLKEIQVSELLHMVTFLFKSLITQQPCKKSDGFKNQVNQIKERLKQPAEQLIHPSFAPTPHFEERKRSVEMPIQKNGFQIHHMTQKVDKYDD